MGSYPGQVSWAVSSSGLIYLIVELAVLKGSYVIFWCEKIGEGRMERKKANHRGAPGVSLDCVSPQLGLLTMLVEGQKCLRVSCQRHGPKKMSNPLQSVP